MKLKDKRISGIILIISLIGLIVIHVIETEYTWKPSIQQYAMVRIIAYFSRSKYFDIKSGLCTKDNLKSCKYYAKYLDKPPLNIISKYPMSIQCVVLANYARMIYTENNNGLIWNEELAEHAKKSAQYSLDNNCWDCHTDSGTSWGQNLYLSKNSCADAYDGWVTNEALGLDPVNINEGHFQNVVGFAANYVTIGCGVASSDSQSAIVCNYGL